MIFLFGQFQIRRRWKAQMLSLASMTHTNLCKIIGFSYEREAKEKGECLQQCRGIGFIVWDDPQNGNLYELLHNGIYPHIDWPTRLKIAIGIAEGVSFLLENMLNQVLYPMLV